MVDPREHVMLPEESSGQGEQDQQLGKISHDAQIQKSVRIVRLRAETETAAFIGMDHESREEKFRDLDGIFAVETDPAGYGSGSDQLFQGNAEVSQLPQLETV